jgi:hypothetical protein
LLIPDGSNFGTLLLKLCQNIFFLLLKVLSAGTLLVTDSWKGEMKSAAAFYAEVKRETHKSLSLKTKNKSF